MLILCFFAKCIQNQFEHAVGQGQWVLLFDLKHGRLEG